ncbi:hypothetical protein [Mycobacterium sp. 2YAF39]|uniref:hypothetical protein n=1 Tax=Mycobacterium sp. 2YAF39 TaxID=3233033 RepID=UPI003F95E954
MADKEFRNFIARFAAATMAAGSIFGGAALGLAAGAHASPTVQVQAQQERAMHAKTDPAARRQEGTRIPPRESAPQRRPAAPGEPPQHHMPQRKGGAM